MRIEFNALGLTFDAKVIEFYPGRPERVSGPPEDCYEAEQAEIEIDYLQVVKPGTDEKISCNWLLDSDCAEEICQHALDAMIQAYDYRNK